MLEKLYESMISYNTDISICAVHQFDETAGKIDDSNPYYTLGFFDKSFDNRAFSYKDTKPFIMDVCVMAWNKLYRRSHIEKCNAEFPEGLIFEDGPFFFSIFFKTERVSIVRDFLYYYRVNRKGSIIHKAGSKFLNLIDVVELMYNKAKAAPDFEDFKYTFFVKKVEDFIYRFEHIRPKYRWAFAQKIKNKSSLTNDEVFDPKMVKGRFKYNYYLFQNLKTGNVFLYDWRKFKMQCMYKTMEIMYKEQGVYYIKTKNIEVKIKKNPKMLDIYYSNDRIYVIAFRKFKFDFPFRYSTLERFNEDD